MIIDNYDDDDNYNNNSDDDNSLILIVITILDCSDISTNVLPKSSKESQALTHQPTSRTGPHPAQGDADCVVGW